MFQGIGDSLLQRQIVGLDREIATWFHARLTKPSVDLLCVLSGPGSGVWIGIVLTAALVYLLWKRRGYALVKMLLIVPGGMLLAEGLKLLVQRHRPFIAGQFMNWEGYSFPSGHTIGATLLYGMIFVAAIPLFKAWRWRLLAMFIAALLVVLVGFSRIALGAHYLTDVLAAIFLGILWLAICLTLVGTMRRTLAWCPVTNRQSLRQW